MTDITELAQREKFEAWARSQKLGLSYGDCGYVFSSTEMAWRAWMASSSELVEALEKAQAQSSKWLEAYHKAVSIGARYEERIAELESRTVKLPDLRQIVSGDRYVWSDGVYNYSQDVKVALAAAGIKVEDE
ncbi:hypothetical protein FP361_27580 [Klebsiella pneumoniae]|nr:hypothetical protein [Klebsiella pneumoniae]